MTSTIRKTYSSGGTSIAVRTIVNGTQNMLNWSQVPSLLIIQRRHSAPPKRSGRGLLSDHTSTGSVEPWVPPPLPPQPTVASGFDIIIKSSREALPKWNVGSTWFSELRYSAFGRKRFQNYSFNETAQHPWNEMEGAKRAIPPALHPHPNGCRRIIATPPFPLSGSGAGRSATTSGHQPVLLQREISCPRSVTQGGLPPECNAGWPAPGV